MPRSVETTEGGIPSGGDRQALRHFGDGSAGNLVAARLQAYDSSTLAYVDVVVDSSGQLKTVSAGGSGGAVTVADGADVAQGTTTDPSSANTIVGILKAIKAAITGTLTVGGTVTANAGTNLNTSALALDATLTGGTQKSKLVDTGGTNVASVSVAGALKVDASGVAVPITDNAGSLTVDAPVGTPAFVRLSDGAAAITALPVTESGTWTVQPGNTPNTAPWLASVHDGTTKAKVTVVNAQPANTDGALLVNAIDTFAGTVLASASRGAGTVNTDLVNYNGKGIRVWQDLTVLGASSVCQFSIQEKDPVSGKFVTLLASAATGAGINSTGTAKLTVYPGLTAAANVTASDVVPMNIRIVSAVTVAASTFSIGYALIP